MQERLTKEDGGWKTEENDSKSKAMKMKHKQIYDVMPTRSARKTRLFRSHDQEAHEPSKRLDTE